MFLERVLSAHCIQLNSRLLIFTLFFFPSLFPLSMTISESVGAVSADRMGANDLGTLLSDSFTNCELFPAAFEMCFYLSYHIMCIRVSVVSKWISSSCQSNILIGRSCQLICWSYWKNMAVRCLLWGPLKVNFVRLTTLVCVAALMSRCRRYCMALEYFNTVWLEVCAVD